MGYIIMSLSLLALSLLPLSLPCPLLLQAFQTVANFHYPAGVSCSAVVRLHLPASNLSGAVSWSHLAALPSLRSLDLSRNSLAGSIPSSFFFSPSLRHLSLAHNRLGGPLRLAAGSGLRTLNLSRNHFTSVTNISSLQDLTSLDLSHNLISVVPPGLSRLRRVAVLDVSWNNMSGSFPSDFPDVGVLQKLDISHNDLAGVLDSGTAEKFGSAAFVDAGKNLVYEHSRRRRKKIAVIAVVTSCLFISVVGVLLLVIVVVMRRRRRKKGKKKGWGEEEGEIMEVPRWVAEARWGARVVFFEKPLMEMTFGELAGATSGFGREAQMEGGRSGAAMYRAVLGRGWEEGEMEVVVRVVRRREEEEEEVMKEVGEVGRLRHPNLLPLIGYCIAGMYSMVNSLLLLLLQINVKFFVKILCSMKD